MVAGEEAVPEGAGLGFGGGVVGADVAQVAVVAHSAVDKFVNHPPIRQAAHIAVVDEEVGLQLAAADGRAVLLLVGEVAVDGKKLHASFGAETNGIVQQFALTDRPQNQAVTLLLQPFQRGGCKGYFTPDFGVLMFDDRAVEIYCNYHLSGVNGEQLRCSNGANQCRKRGYFEVRNGELGI